MLEASIHEWLNSNTSIMVSPDRMEAQIRLNRSFSDINLSQEDLIYFLNEKGIVFGIYEMSVKEIIENKIIGKNIVIAHGIQAQDGEDGHFDFLFNTNVDNAPCILEDGSVDYSIINRIETVTKDQEIVNYIKRTPGKPGTDVYGNRIPAKDGKELSPLRGKGFTCSEDNTVYYAAIDGRIEYKDDKLFITNVLEIKEDITYLSNHVSFGGDILINGDVLSGTSIRAKGNIHIKGHVENVILVSGKDIILDKGMQGGGKGTILCGGNLSGKFFEQVKIQAAGSVSANAILNCEVEAGDRVTVSGKRGVILGGRVSAIAGVSAVIIGNETEVKTCINVGLPDDYYVELKAIEQQIQILIQRLAQIDSALEMISERDEPGVPNPYQKQKVQLFRTRITINTEIAENTKKRNEILSSLSKAADAKVRVERYAEPGVDIWVNGLFQHISTRCMGIEIIRNGMEIEQRPIV